MIIETKIFDENGNTIMNNVKDGNPAFFFLDFPSLPLVNDPVLIHDGNARGEYVVSKIVHEIKESKALPIMILHRKPLEDGIRIAIDN